MRVPCDYDSYLLESVLVSIPVFVEQETAEWFFRDDKERHDILISTLLTIIDWIDNKKYIRDYYKTAQLYNLDPSYRDIINVLANKCMSRIMTEIKEVLNIKQSLLMDEFEQEMWK